MATETELKLRIDPEHIDTLLKHPLLSLAPRRQHLYNTYFDTTDLALSRQKVAVRERRVDDRQLGELTLLTVKTAGNSSGGLSQRREWEAPSQAGVFDFERLVDDASLAKTLAVFAVQLVPVFTTDFERLSWRVPVANSEVEVALDRGAILVNRNGRQASVPICELELELKSGDIDALNDLAAQLRATTPLTPTDDSKAARGYQLFQSLAQ